MQFPPEKSLNTSVFRAGQMALQIHGKILNAIPHGRKQIAVWNLTMAFLTEASAALCELLDVKEHTSRPLQQKGM